MAGTKVSNPSGSAPGGDIASDYAKIAAETRRDAIASAQFQRDMAKIKNWEDAQKQHSDQIRTAARA